MSKTLAEIKLRNLQEEAMMARALNNCDRLLVLKVEIDKLKLEELARRPCTLSGVSAHPVKVAA